MKYIPSIVVAALMLCWPLAKAHADLTPANIQFLQQCKVIQADIDVIPKLSQEIQTKIASWITAKDCRKLVPYNASRKYFKELKSTVPLPLPPAGWNGAYLTEEEFAQYVDILTNAPW
jgi:hypothetical protein